MSDGPSRPRGPAGFDAAQRRALARRLRERGSTGEPLCCPACDAELSERPVAPPPALPYVRHRVWLLCTSCGRTAAVDVDGRH